MFVLYFPQFSTQIYQILLSYAYFSYIEDYMREIIYTSLPIPSSPKNVISVHNVTFMLSTVENSCFFSNKQFHNFFSLSLSHIKLENISSENFDRVYV